VFWELWGQWSSSSVSRNVLLCWNFDKVHLFLIERTVDYLIPWTTFWLVPAPTSLCTMKQNSITATSNQLKIHDNPSYAWAVLLGSNSNNSGLNSVGNQLIKWSWALLEKPPILQPLKNFPKFYVICRFITMFTRALNWSLSSAWSIQSISPHSISLRSILILSTHMYSGDTEFEFQLQWLGFHSFRSKCQDNGLYLEIDHGCFLYSIFILNEDKTDVVGAVLFLWVI
jgi:hypothetical protein